MPRKYPKGCSPQLQALLTANDHNLELTITVIENELVKRGYANLNKNRFEDHSKPKQEKIEDVWSF